VLLSHYRQRRLLIASRIKVRSNRQLVRNDNTPIQKSLFDYVPEEDFNELEKSVAIYLDEQERLLWWYQDVFALCNELGAKKAWKELFSEFSDHRFEFQVVFGDEWANRINKMFE